MALHISFFPFESKKLCSLNLSSAHLSAKKKGLLITWVDRISFMRCGRQPALNLPRVSVSDARQSSVQITHEKELT